MLDLDHKIYQMIIGRIDGDKLASPSYQDMAVKLVQKGIGGFIFFGGKKDAVRSFIHKLQSSSDIPLFIASDVERGVGQQVEGASHFPSQMAVAAAVRKSYDDDRKTFEDLIHALCDEAIDIGINMPLIPVLDVNRNPDNPIICTRAFSDNPEDVAWYGKRCIKIVENSGLISCAKHFPGHGDTDTDSHISLPVISKSLQELTNADLFPFQEAMKAGVSSIMVGHLCIPAVNTKPASLSKKIIADLLRKDSGYDGLVMTDALNMHALKEVGTVFVKCIHAGVDILLHPENVDAAAEQLKESIAAGELEKEKIETAVTRIMKYKSKLKKIKKSEPNYERNARIARAITDKSITLVKGKPGLLPLKDIQGISLLFDCDKNEHDVSALRDFIPESFSAREYKNDFIRDTLIIALFTSVAAWKGSSGIPEESIHKIKTLTKKCRKSIVISFGSPYVLRHFAEADALVAAFDATRQAQVSVIECLRGERGFTGELPVTLSFF